MMTIVLGLILGIAGLVTVTVTSMLILGPLRRPLFAAVERARLRRCLSRCDHGDARLAANDLSGALREFSAAFCFVVPRGDPRLLAEIARLHAGLLSRLMSIVDDFPGKRVELLALAKVERLLDQWIDIQRRMVRESASGRDTATVRRQRDITQRAIRDLVKELLARRHHPLVH
jgi:hypothetical protein